MPTHLTESKNIICIPTGKFATSPLVVLTKRSSTPPARFPSNWIVLAQRLRERFQQVDRVQVNEKVGHISFILHQMLRYKVRWYEIVGLCQAGDEAA